MRKNTTAHLVALPGCPWPVTLNQAKGSVIPDFRSHPALRHGYLNRPGMFWQGQRDIAGLLGLLSALLPSNLRPDQLLNCSLD